VDGIIVGSMRQREGEEMPSLERRLTSGNHVVIVEARGRQTWSNRFHLAAGETFSVDLKFRTESQGRKIARLSLTAAGAVAVVSGLVLGSLAIRDVRSDDQERRDRGKSRANTTDILLGLGAVSLAGGWYLKKSDTRATVERSAAVDASAERDEISLRIR
jgi:hypothetical protein